MSNKVKVKILISLIISIIMFNFICSNTVIASSVGEELVSVVKIADVDDGMLDDESDPSDFNSSFGLDEETSITPERGFMDGITAIAVKILFTPLVLLGTAMQSAGSFIGDSAGNVSRTDKFITPKEILFNKLAITDINFFDIKHFGFGDDKQSLSGSNNPIQILKQNVRDWYNALRTIAIIILLCVLIYIGIRMVMASNPDSKRNYKKMLIDWAISFAILFLLHYLIILVITGNNILVGIIEDVGSNTLKVTNSSWDTYLNGMVTKIYTATSGAEAFGTAIAYFGICFATLVFLIMYIKRMITLAFLILISPLITITYSIDKAGDGSAQAFGNWMKEFFRGVLIQPFHCIIYVSIVSIAMGLVQQEGASLGAMLLLILTMKFMMEAEDIIKNIFDLKAKSTGDSGFATAMMLGTFIQKTAPKVKGGMKLAGAGAVAAGSKVKNRIAEKNVEAVDKGQGKTTPITNKEETKIDNKQVQNNANKQAGTGKGNTGTGKTEGKADDGGKKTSGSTTNSGVGKDAAKDAVDELNRSGAIKDAAKDAAKQVDVGKNDINIKNTNEPSLLGSAIDMATSGIGWVAEKSMQASGATAGFMMSTMGNGDLPTIWGSTVAGKQAGENLYGTASNIYDSGRMKLENAVRGTRIRENERILANTFDNYKAQKGEQYNYNKDLQDVQNYLNMTDKKIEEMKEGSEKQYVQSIHAMRDLYNKNFEDDPNERVMQVMEQIIRNRVKPEN